MPTLQAPSPVAASAQDAAARTVSRRFFPAGLLTAGALVGSVGSVGTASAAGADALRERSNGKHKKGKKDKGKGKGKGQGQGVGPSGIGGRPHTGNATGNTTGSTQAATPSSTPTTAVQTPGGQTPGSGPDTGTTTPEPLPNVPDPQLGTGADMLLLRRFTYGLSAGLQGQVGQAGSVGAWFNQQLNPSSVPDTPGTEVAGWYPKLQQTPLQMWGAYKSNGSMANTTLADDLSRYTLMRRLRSNRQVLEVMTEFWANLLHVPAPEGKCWPQRADYDQTLRRHALTSFDQLLSAAIVHPAMLLYLDAYSSTKTAPNENLGRELLELHTVGQGAGYSETDVLNSTRILTGWTVDRAGSWEGAYDPAGHHTGPVQVLSFSDANAAADGRATTMRYLDYLAHHPSTALRVAEKLLVRFVSDVPSAQYVAAVAAAFTASGTDIPTTLRAIVTHPEFVTGSTAKLRTPTEDYVATLRALQMDVASPASADDLANYCVWTVSGMGQRPFDWPTPDGFPDAAPAWASAARLLGSWGTHTNLAAGSVAGTTSPNINSWLPPLPATVEQIVATAARKLLFTDPDAPTMAAACASVGQRPGDVISARHQFVVAQRMKMLLATLLDSPLHLNR